MGVKMFAGKDYYLSKRVENLTADRDSALQNSQDLLHGMQVAYVQLILVGFRELLHALCIQWNVS